jgi:hypothetical protein
VRQRPPPGTTCTAMLASAPGAGARPGAHGGRPPHAAASLTVTPHAAQAPAAAPALARLGSEKPAGGRAA